MKNLIILFLSLFLTITNCFFVFCFIFFGREEDKLHCFALKKQLWLWETITGVHMNYESWPEQAGCSSGA